MKRALLLLAVCLSISTLCNAQTKKPVRKSTQTGITQAVTQTLEPPSANGTFKFIYSKEKQGFFNNTDDKDFVIISVPGKSASDIKSSIISTLSSMYSQPSKVISTLGDNIINVTAYSSDAFQYLLANELRHYSFTYNIKIEIKDGKIKIDSPLFSNISVRIVFMGETVGTDYIDDFYFELYRAKKQLQQEKVENILNSHITKIISGLSNSDW